jgi:hypothetical protein
VLGYLPKSDSLVLLLNDLLNDSQPDTRREVIVALMKQGEEPPDYHVARLLADPYHRLLMYRSLERAGALSGLPVVYRTQEQIGAGLAFEWLYMEEAYPEVIRSVGEREMPEARYYIYKFRYSADDESPWYAAVVPQPLDRSQIDSAPARAVSEYEELDAKTIEEHVEAYRLRIAD